MAWLVFWIAVSWLAYGEIDRNISLSPFPKRVSVAMT